MRQRRAKRLARPQVPQLGRLVQPGGDEFRAVRAEGDFIGRSEVRRRPQRLARRRVPALDSVVHAGRGEACCGELRAVAAEDHGANHPAGTRQSVLTNRLPGSQNSTNAATQLGLIGVDRRPVGLAQHCQAASRFSMLQFVDATIEVRQDKLQLGLFPQGLGRFFCEAPRGHFFRRSRRFLPPSRRWRRRVAAPGRSGAAPA